MILQYIYWLRNLVFVLVLLVVVTGFAYVKLDQAINFQSVQATVLGYEKFCRPESSDQDTQSLFDASSDFAHRKLGPCGALAQFGIDEQTFQMLGRSINLRVWRVWRTNVRFISPADGQLHESTLELGPKDGEGLAVGKTLTLKASKRDWRLLEEP
jgi:hypothetical protein